VIPEHSTHFFREIRAWKISALRQNESPTEELEPPTGHGVLGNGKLGKFTHDDAGQMHLLDATINVQ